MLWEEIRFSYDCESTKKLVAAKNISKF